jgi:membrane fusion protein, heavy metal efflux system
MTFYSKYIVLASLTLLISCNKEQDNKQKSVQETLVTNPNLVKFTPQQLKQVEIVTSKLTQTNLSKTITVNGMTRLRPENEMEISSLIDGQFKNSKLVEGMQVTKGQVLAQLENLQLMDMQEQYLVAKAKFNLAKADYERQKELNKTQSASNKVVQQTAFEFNQQAILIQTLGSKLSMLGINTNNLNSNNLQRSVTIRAPFTGYIDKVLVTNGMYVNTNTPLFKIINADNLNVVLKVYQDDLPYLKINQRITAFTNNNNQNQLNGTIKFINTQLTPEGYGEVTCTLDNQENLTPGMYLNAKIELSEHQVYALPKEAVLEYEGKKIVYIQNAPGNYELMEIETGVIENDFIEVKNHEKLLNKNIVSKNAYAILMKSKNVADEE